MARIRSIKPEFWRDAKVLRLSPEAKLLFIGSWNFCDDDGRMVWDPEQVVVDLFSGSPSIDIEALVAELTSPRTNMVQLYDVDGVRYYQVRNFSKHQKVDRRIPSKLPPPPQNPCESRQIPAENGGTRDASAEVGGNRRESAADGNPRAGMEGNGKEGKGKEENPPSPPAGGDAQPSAKKLVFTPEDRALAERIADGVRAVAPSAKPNIDAWANAVRLMREQDGRTHDQIERLFRFANRDAFWQSNILSPGKLREKWAQLEAKMLKSGGGRPDGGATPSGDFSKGVGAHGEF